MIHIRNYTLTLLPIADRAQFINKAADDSGSCLGVHCVSKETTKENAESSGAGEEQVPDMQQPQWIPATLPGDLRSGVRSGFHTENNSEGCGRMNEDEKMQCLTPL